MTGNISVAVGCAVAGAASFGLAGAAQERATKAVAREPRQRFLLGLLRRPLWLAGTLALGFGVTMQVVALAFGPVALVQPVGVLSALFGAGFATAMARQRLDWVAPAGAIACAGGLALFLLSARPTEAADEVTPHIGPVSAGVLAALAVTAVGVGIGRRGEPRAVALAVATGISYGVTAALLKATATEVRVAGLPGLVTHWPTYAAIAVGFPGFVLSQHAFREGRLVSTTLAVITSVCPLVATAVGVSWLNEHVTTTPIALTRVAAGAAAIVGGVVVLARHADHVRRADRRAHDVPIG